MEGLVQGGHVSIGEKDAQGGEIGDIGQDVHGGPKVADDGILEIVDGGDKGAEDDKKHGEVNVGGKVVAEIEALKKRDEHRAEALPNGEDGEVDVAEALGVGENKDDEKEDGERHGADKTGVELAGICVAGDSSKGYNEYGDEVLKGEGEPGEVEVSV